MKIYISGLYCGTNPQPGVGIARSLRMAYPSATLIGVEYSNRCSGVHWQDLDDVWLHRPWEELNLDSHAAAIKEVLDAGGLWISSIDLEIMWLGSVFPDGHPNLLIPSLAALQKVSKPEVQIHKYLPVKIPTYVTTEISDWELHAFCREHDWRVWLKGPYYEAVKVRSWAELEAMRGILSSAWSTERLFLQTHVSGYEESITLSAYQGDLIHCVSMRKRDLTEMSKTWAGDVAQVGEEFLAPLRETIKQLNWSGGAELEMVRDAQNQLWLLEVNPRFPAWIHGATIAGHNMSALLVERVTGVPAQETVAVSEEFTRVVLEVPVRPEFPLSPLPEPLAGRLGHSLKHPSGLLQFANRLHNLNVYNHEDGDAPNGDGQNGHHENGNGGAAAKTKPIADVPATFVEDLTEVDMTTVETPSFLFFEKTARDLFRKADERARELSTDQLKIVNAYSMKTNPDERLLKIALENGFLAEGISLLEIEKALKAGFRSEQTILNGPGKFWHQEALPKTPLYSIFCDSIEDFKRVVEGYESGEIKTEIIGMRLRTPNIHSRFGIPIDTPEAFGELIELVKTLPRDVRFGIHFHMASSNVGVGQWWRLFESILRWCGSIEALSGRTIEVLDIGGGWFPEDLQKDSGENFKKALRLVPEFLPHVRELINEPGKALAQPSMAVAMQILEIRNHGGDRREVVVDGSIAELPMYFFYPHRILCQDRASGDWRSLNRGKTQLLGRLCMEHDIVANNVELPIDAQIGDVLVFCDAGAYDRSMSYVFGRG